MAKKPVRNKFGGILGDYWRANREVSQEESQREGYRGGPVTSREKAMVIVAVFLVLILITKSCFIDEVRNLGPEDAQFKDFVEYAVSEKYTGAFDRAGLMKYRVYDLYVAKKGEKVQLKYTDPDSGRSVETFQEDRRNARVRGYFMWVVPVKHFSITAPAAKGKVVEKGAEDQEKEGKNEKPRDKESKGK